MYNITNIQITETPDATEPVTLDEVKAWLEIDFSDKDLLLTGMLKGARQSIEKMTSLPLVESTVTLDVESTSAAIVDLPFTKTVANLVVKELDDDDGEETLTVDADYFLRGNGLRLPLWGRYSVSYKTVPGEIPEDIKEAIKMEVAERFANRGENAGEFSKSAMHKLQPHIVQWL